LNFRFEHSEYLLPLALIPVMIFLFTVVIKWKNTTLKKIGNEKLVKLLILNYSRRNFLIKFVVICIAFALTSFAAANFQTPGGGENIRRQGLDVMIALDVSKSMMATDIQPNRLEKAKLLVNRLIDKLENDQIGLVLFAGRAYIQMPLTSDHAAAKIYVSSASPDAVPTQGTVIADALEMCNSAFSKKDKKYKVVILISDGEDHDPRAADLSKQLADDGVLINTVGVGTPTGSTIIDPNTKEMKRDDKGNPVISKLNEAELSQIAQASKGQYQLLTDTDEASDRIVQQIDAMEQKSITDQNAANYRSHFQWFVVIALALLMADILIAERNQSDRKSRKITVA